MINYIALVVLSPIMIGSAFIKPKKLFVIVNLICIVLLVIYYGVVIYVEYKYTFEYVNTHTMEALLMSARVKFNNILYHLSAMTALLVINAVVFAGKLLKADKPQHRQPQRRL